MEFCTQGFNGYAVKYSPFFDSKLAVATATNYGLVGNGRLYILDLTANGVVADKWYDTQDAVYDLAWSEMNENQVLAATGDGSIKLFDITLDKFPVQVWSEHGREVFAVQWNLVTKDTFCSSSWDGTIKIYVPDRHNSILTLPVNSCSYSASFSPHAASLLSSVSSDSHLRIFDLRTPLSASDHLTLAIPIHSVPPNHPSFNKAYSSVAPSEALTHDWNKYRSTVIATAGVDRLIRTFDIRAPDQGPLAIIPGHDFAIRKIAWSPHLSNVLLSASYDMTCRVWSDSSTKEIALRPSPNNRTEDPLAPFGGGKELGRMGQHTEFVMGVDWCLFGDAGWCATCGWDEKVFVWDTKSVM